MYLLKPLASAHKNENKIKIAENYPSEKISNTHAILRNEFAWFKAKQKQSKISNKFQSLAALRYGLLCQ